MKFLAVINKDIRSELRTKVALSSLTLFVFISIILIYFELQQTELKENVLSALYWIIFFFASIAGMSVNFQKEADKKTLDFLNISVNGISIWLGKLIYNIILSILINSLQLFLFSLLIRDFISIDLISLVFVSYLGGIAIASTITVLSAIIVKGGAKNFVLPVLSMPVILPAIIVVTNITSFYLGAVVQTSAESGIITLISYIAVVNAASWMLFDIIWKD